MLKYILLSFCLLCTVLVTAQTADLSEKNDPEAKRLLDKVRKKYESYKTLEAGFTLTIELPEQAKTVQKGKIGQEGDKFHLEMDQQTIVSDGKSTWVYLKKNKEIQINDANDGGTGDFLTPKDLLTKYQKGEYLYALNDKSTEKGVFLSHIEFKPKDKKSEYSKIRVSIDEKNKKIVSIKAFSKDGGRYTFLVTSFSPNKKFEANHFVMDTAKYPGVHVEDLRM